MSQLIQIDDIGHRRAGQPPPAPPGPSWSALWALGFRPFYLLASAHAALAVPLWMAQHAGLLRLPVAHAMQVHAQEMVFGFAAAVIVGFLFTAGRNWSGHATPRGPALMLLAALWLAARVLAWTPWLLAAALANALFLAGAAAGLARALLRSPNRRNDFFIAVLLGLALASTLVHLARAGVWAVSPQAWLQVALDLVLIVMSVMAGRVVPMFTVNAIRHAGAQRLPLLERLCTGTALGLLGLDTLQAAGGTPAGLATALQPGAGVTLVLACALAHLARSLLWRPWRTLRHPLVWTLHLAMLWVPVHLGLRALGALGVVAPVLATHALTVGAMGGLILGMLVRTTRGHTGALLQADRWDVSAFGLVALAALLRCVLPLLWPGMWMLASQAAALAWSAAFALYAWRYVPSLIRPRADGQPG